MHGCLHVTADTLRGQRHLIALELVLQTGPSLPPGVDTRGRTFCPPEEQEAVFTAESSLELGFFNSLPVSNSHSF